MPGARKLTVGDPAPPFTVHASGGAAITMEEYRGGPLLLIFIRHLL